MVGLRLGFLVLAAFLVFNDTYAQLSSQEVDLIVEKVMERFHVAGAAVGIVKDGKTIHSKGYGVKSVDSGQKVDAHTPFAIASNSKAFTAAALAILVDQGKISWKDKVILHLPEFKMYNTYVTENFNIQDLLTHRSGLGLGAGDLMFWPDGSNFTIQDVLTGFQYFEPQSAFRTKYDYDNLLYLVAGEIIARVGGMSWEDFVKQHIFDPLQMEETYGSYVLIEEKGKSALPHIHSNESVRTIPHFRKTINGAAGGIYSTADNLCNWMLVHLNGGKYGKDLEKELFSGAAQREMWKIHTSFITYPDERYNPHFSGYGLGWNLRDIRGNRLASHGGLLPGMASETVLIPDLRLGIVVLTNTTDEAGNSGLDAIVNTIMDSYLGLEDHNWTEMIYESLQNRKNEADKITKAVWDHVEGTNNHLILPLDYIGMYEDNWFGKVEVYMEKDQLWIRSLRSPKLNGPLRYYKANAFAIKWEYQDMNGDAFAIFSLDEEGKAQRIKLKGISPDIDFSFDFQDLDLRRIN